SRRGRGGGKSGNARQGVVDGEVHRVRRAAARGRIGHHHGIASLRSLVAGGQGDRQLARAHQRRRVPNAVVSHRRGGEEIRAVDGQGLGRRSCRGGGRRKAGQARQGIVDGEVHRVRCPASRCRIGHQYSISTLRSLVARTQGDRQLRRTYIGCGVGRPVVRHRRSGDEIRAVDGQGLCRRSRRGGGGRKAGQARQGVVDGEVHRVR